MLNVSENDSGIKTSSLERMAVIRKECIFRGVGNSVKIVLSLSAEGSTL